MSIHANSGQGPTDYTNKNWVENVLIDVSEDNQNSSGIYKAGYMPMGFNFPTTLTTSTTVKWQGSWDNSTWFDILLTRTSATSLITYAVATSGGGGHPMDPKLYAAWPYLRLVTGSAEAADRTFTISFIPIMEN